MDLLSAHLRKNGPQIGHRIWHLILADSEKKTESFTPDQELKVSEFKKMIVHSSLVT